MDEYCQLMPALKALCDETRLSILKMLSNGEKCACRIQDAFNCTQPTISYHMRVLTEAGLVTARRDGCLVCYRIEPALWETIESFINVLAALQKEAM